MVDSGGIIAMDGQALMSTPGAWDGAAGSPLDAAHAAVAVIGAHGVVERWTAGARELLGYRAAEVVGRPVTSLLAGGDAGTPVITERHRVDGCWAARVSVRHHDGHPLELVVRALQLAAVPGEPSWLVVATEAADWRAWEREQAVLRALFSQSPYGMAVMDSQLRYLLINPAQERMDGVAAAPRLGRRPGESMPGGDGSAIEREARQVLDAGVPALALEQFRSAPTDPDSWATGGHVRSGMSYRLQDPSGRVLGVCQTDVDVTRHYRARQRLALVNEASWRIGTTLDLLETARELTDVLVPRVTDFVSIDLVDAVVRAEELHPGPVDEGETLRRAAHRSIHKDLPEAVVQPGEPSRHVPGSLPTRCLRTGQAILRTSVDPAEPELVADAARAAKVRQLGIHSAMAVPLQARGITMGVVSLARWKNPDPFDEDDLLLVEELVARAAVCIDNARRFTREHNAALALQRSLLPHGLPRQSAVDAAYRYLPADVQAGVGGDWFDIIPLSGARVALVVGDVVGHGIHAAATMGRLRTAVHTLADLDLPPDELLAHLDDLVIRLSEEEESKGSLAGGSGVIGATCVYAVYDPIDRRATVARAGHPAPVISRRDDPVEMPDVPAGPPLGLGGLPFECADIEIAEGSVLAFFTDGLIEAGDRDIDTGFERLFFTLAHPDRPLEEICDTMVRTLLPDRPHDDVAFLIARTRGLPDEDIAFWDLPGDPAAVADARHRAGRQMTAWGLEEAAFTTELIVSELITNAVRYGSEPIRLRLIRDRHLICEVSDGSNTAPHLRHARSTDEGGRGLFLVAQCAQRWGTRYTPHGKTIWAEQWLAPPAGQVA
ncbi:SpoIIE family protein phosphatase [Streptomyces sp. NPDC018031]|uniref:SpoIIE family protein phosphatase n=1 Tax=Streptomyces sp. NPDC018031 TaxID=3365033 RepID=UPI00379DDEB1